MPTTTRQDPSIMLTDEEQQELYRTRAAAYVHYGHSSERAGDALNTSPKNILYACCQVGQAIREDSGSDVLIVRPKDHYSEKAVAKRGNSRAKSKPHVTSGQEAEVRRAAEQLETDDVSVLEEHFGYIVDTEIIVRALADTSAPPPPVRHSV